MAEARKKNLWLHIESRCETNRELRPRRILFNMRLLPQGSDRVLSPQRKDKAITKSQMHTLFVYYSLILYLPSRILWIIGNESSRRRIKGKTRKKRKELRDGNTVNMMNNRERNS